MAHRSFSLLKYADAPTTGRLAAAPASSATASLTRVVRDLALNLNAWIGRVRLGTDDRWYERLCDGPDYDVWAISWMPGQSTGFHDHGGSSGVFLVVSGELQEQRPGAESLVVSKGDIQVFGPRLRPRRREYLLRPRHQPPCASAGTERDDALQSRRQ